MVVMTLKMIGGDISSFLLVYVFFFCAFFSLLHTIFSVSGANLYELVGTELITSTLDPRLTFLTQDTFAGVEILSTDVLNEQIGTLATTAQKLIAKVVQMFWAILGSVVLVNMCACPKPGPAASDHTHTCRVPRTHLPWHK